MVGVVALTIWFGAAHPLLYRGLDAGSRRAIWAALYVAAALAVWWQRARLRDLDRSFWILGLLPAATALLSLAWTENPRQTALWGLGLVGTTLAGMALGLWPSREPVLGPLRAVAAVAIAGSSALALARPDVAIGTPVHPTAWSGLFSHKNVLGWSMVVAAVAWSFGVAQRPIAAPAWMAAAAALCVLSESRASWILLAAAVAARGAQELRVPRAGRAVAIVALLAATTFVAWHGPAVLRALGRDTTLTGRTEVWAVAVELSGERPVLGRGYAAVSSNDATMRSPLRSRVSWSPEHAHNGFLDVVLELGLVGLAATAAVLASLIVLARREKSSLATFAQVFLLLLLAQNLVESTLLRANRFEWALVVALHVALARGAGPHAGLRAA